VLYIDMLSSSEIMSWFRDQWRSPRIRNSRLFSHKITVKMAPDNLFWPKKIYVYKFTKDLHKIWQPRNKRGFKEETLSLELQLGHPDRHLQVAMHESLKIAWTAQALNCDQIRGLPVLHILVPGWIKCGVMSPIPHTSYCLITYKMKLHLHVNSTQSTLEFEHWNTTFLKVCMCRCPYVHT